jgi:hypothetical protein
MLGAHFLLGLLFIKKLLSLRTARISPLRVAIPYWTALWQIHALSPEALIPNTILDPYIYSNGEWQNTERALCRTAQRLLGCRAHCRSCCRFLLAVIPLPHQQTLEMHSAFQMKSKRFD